MSVKIVKFLSIIGKKYRQNHNNGHRPGSHGGADHRAVLHRLRHRRLRPVDQAAALQVKLQTKAVQCFEFKSSMHAHFDTERSPPNIFAVSKIFSV
jgi:hypothetical protein